MQTPQRSSSPPVSNGTVEQDQAVRQFLRLALGADKYAVQIAAVREILQVAPTTPLPLMPSFVRGVMNLRGAVVPVVDLGARLDLAATDVGRRTCVVIVDLPGADEERPQTLGVLVDAVYEVFDAPAADQEPVPRLGTRIDPGYIRSMVRVRGESTPELDLGAILDQQLLAKLIAAHAGGQATDHEEPRSRGTEHPASAGASAATASLG